MPFQLEWELKDCTFFVPQRGDKKHLLDLSIMNGRQYRVDHLKQTEKLNPEQRQTRLMKELQQKLGLPTLPFQIECFDNSNISCLHRVQSDETIEKRLSEIQYKDRHWP